MWRQGYYIQINKKIRRQMFMELRRWIKEMGLANLHSSNLCRGTVFRP